MRKITLLIALFFFQIVASQIPDWEWARNVNISFNSWKHYTAVDSNGDIIVITDYRTPVYTIGNVTLTNNSQSDYADIAIVKYDNQGNVLWAKSFGGVEHDTPVAITTDTSGNFYVTGSFKHSIAFESTTLTAAISGSFIAKFDMNGNVIFAKKCGENGSYVETRAIKTDTNGNIYLAGAFNSPSVTFGNITLNYEHYSNTVNTYRSFVAKMDNQGNYIWAKAGQSSNAHYIGIMPFAIDVDTSGNVYSGGYFGCNTINFGNITLTKTTTYNFNFNMYLVKYDSNGNEMWARNTGSDYDNSTCTYAIKTDHNNNVFAAGYFTNQVHFGNVTLMSSGGSQMFTVKYDTNGNALWAKNPFSTYGYNTIQSIDVDAAGNLYVGGMYTNSEVDFGNGVVLTKSNAIDDAAFVVKYTPSGNAVWGRSAQSLNANNITSIDCKSENEIYFAGTFNNSTITFGNHTLTKSGNYVDLFLAKLYYEPLSTVDWDKNQNKIYPNPVKDKLYISHPEIFSTYTLYTILGAKVKSGFIEQKTGNIDLSTLPKGVYLVNLISRNGNPETIKIIKE